MTTTIWHQRASAHFRFLAALCLRRPRRADRNQAGSGAPRQIVIDQAAGTLSNAPGGPSPYVLFVGGLPPPVHGASSVNRAMLRIFTEAGIEVWLIDTAARSFRSSRGLRAPRSVRYAWAAGLACTVRRERASALYISLPGGLTLWYVVPVVAAAKLRGTPIVFHHHSYAYITRRRLAMVVIQRLARSLSLNVVLCGDMGSILQRRYGVEEVVVCSNAAMVDEVPDDTLAPQGDESSQQNSFRIGFFGNVTFEKGLRESVNVTERLWRDGQDVELLVGGPIPAEEGLYLEAAKANGIPVSLLGALYGPAKHLFFQSIDVLLFPSRYENEAEPLVIHEALSHGVPVIATIRGCLPDMLAKSGWCFKEDDYVDSALRVIRANVLRPNGSVSVPQMSRPARSRWIKLRDVSRSQREELVERIASAAFTTHVTHSRTPWLP